MRVAVMGAGAEGTAATVELSLAGHAVALWSRSPATLAPFIESGFVGYEGVLGDGKVQPALMTVDVRAAIAEAEAALVCLPTFSHRPVAQVLAENGLPSDLPVVLNPGHTGGALEFARTFHDAGRPVPPIAELSTLTYVARKLVPDRVTITSRAKAVRAAALPGGDTALAAAQRLFSSARPVVDVLASGLANVNMVLHPPGAILGAMWIEAKQGEFTFYVEGMTPGVARVMQCLDGERRAVAHAFGHDLPPLVAEMQAIGTVETSVRDMNDLVGAIANGQANRRIKAPDSLDHRYYREDFGHDLLPFLAFAGIAHVPVPISESLFRLGEQLTGTNFRANGRIAERMGIAGLSATQFLARVRQG